jgi:hypothetical protein
MRLEIRKILSILMSVTFGLFAGSEAKASNIDIPATVFSANGSLVAGPGTYTIADGFGDFGSAVVNVDGSGSATVSSITNQSFTSAGWTTQYFFAVEGSVNESVPLQFSATFSTGGNADAVEDVAGVGGNVLGLNQFVCTISNVQGSCGSYPPNFAGSIDFSVASNTVFEIETEASAGALNGFAFANVDPIMVIDPSFPDAGLFTIFYGPGFSPAGSPVSEPGGIFLLGSSLAAFAFFRRGQRKAV